jgi:phage terminase Nu1 subunit (DNA packaging protein)
MRRLYTIHAFNEETGVDRRQIRDWLASTEPAQTIGKSKKYTLAQLVDGIRYASGNINEARIRLTSAQAEKTELEIKVLRADLIPRGDVIKGMGRLVSAVRSRFRSIPSWLAARAVSMTEAEIDHQLGAAIDGALAGLAVGNSEPFDPAAEIDGEPMGELKPATQPRGKRRARTVAD